MGEKPGRITTFVPNLFPETGIGSDMRTGKGTETSFSPLPLFLHGACAFPPPRSVRTGRAVTVRDAFAYSDRAVWFGFVDGKRCGGLFFCFLRSGNRPERSDRLVRSDAPAELSFRAEGAVLFPKRRGADRSGATARPECPRKWRITFRCMRSLPSLRRRKGRSWNAGAMDRERLLSEIGMTAGDGFPCRGARRANGGRYRISPLCGMSVLRKDFLGGAGRGRPSLSWSLCLLAADSRCSAGGCQFPGKAMEFSMDEGATSGRGPQFRTAFPGPVPVFRRGRFERCRSGTEKDAAKGFVSAPEARLP